MTIPQSAARPSTTIAMISAMSRTLSRYSAAICRLREIPPFDCGLFETTSHSWWRFLSCSCLRSRKEAEGKFSCRDELYGPTFVTSEFSFDSAFSGFGWLLRLRWRCFGLFDGCGFIRGRYRAWVTCYADSFEFSGPDLSNDSHGPKDCSAAARFTEGRFETSACPSAITSRRHCFLALGKTKSQWAYYASDTDLSSRARQPPNVSSAWYFASGSARNLWQPRWRICGRDAFSLLRDIASKIICKVPSSYFGMNRGMKSRSTPSKTPTLITTSLLLGSPTRWVTDLWMKSFRTEISCWSGSVFSRASARPFCRQPGWLSDTHRSYEKRHRVRIHRCRS